MNLKTICKSLIIIVLLTFSSVIYYACCNRSTTYYTYKSFDFNHSNSDSISYSNAELYIQFKVTFSQTNRNTSFFIEESRADAIRFCDSDFKAAYSDSIKTVKIFNLLESRTDITNLICPSDGKNKSLVEYIQHSIFVQHMKFKTPYPETKHYQLLMEIELQSGTILRDTTAKFYLINFSST